jgi:hypothetical protein
VTLQAGASFFLRTAAWQGPSPHARQRVLCRQRIATLDYRHSQISADFEGRLLSDIPASFEQFRQRYFSAVKSSKHGHENEKAGYPSERVQTGFKVHVVALFNKIRIPWTSYEFYSGAQREKFRDREFLSFWLSAMVRARRNGPIAKVSECLDAARHSGQVTNPVSVHLQPETVKASSRSGVSRFARLLHRLLDHQTQCHRDN